jgi:hypothetical protein
LVSEGALATGSRFDQVRIIALDVADPRAAEAQPENT